MLCEIYEGKHRVDSYIQEIQLPAAYVFTGNFYENQIFRSHVVEYEHHIEFRQPIIKGDVKRKSRLPDQNSRPFSYDGGFRPLMLPQSTCSGSSAI